MALDMCFGAAVSPRFSSLGPFFCVAGRLSPMKDEAGSGRVAAQGNIAVWAWWLAPRSPHAGAASRKALCGRSGGLRHPIRVLIQMTMPPFFNLIAFAANLA